MTAEEWQRVKEVFDAAVDLEPAVRKPYIAEACASQKHLVEEVESLLDSLAQAGDFIEQAKPEKAIDTLKTGVSIGPYRIVQVIGEGGMGTVYQAVRGDDLYRKLVAVKVVRSGPYDDFSRKRFDTERQILAHLDHPNIARLLDAGTTPDGQQYFVMDFIAGSPIDEYCDAQRLSIAQRLRLFLTVCSAVQYAHQNLIIHRDLKPKNILVTPDGSARLLDFGIAKLLDPDAGAIGETVSVVQVMTPEYASPEQLRSEPVTTASDVYSLGVLLYILLTGHRPYVFKTRSAQEMCRTVCEVEPRRPSAVIWSTESVRFGDNEETLATAESVAAVRDTKPDRLSRSLSGDLDNILLMALRKEPQRRYTSVEQFARDIQRHLEGHPVKARQDTVRYRAVKFVNRHVTGVIAAGLIFLTLVAGIIATSWEAHLARQERAMAEQRFADIQGLANAVLFDLHDAIEPLPGSTRARELLVNKAQQYLDKLGADSAGDRSLEHERALSYERIGDVLGLSTQPNLGKTGDAVKAYEKALEIESALVRQTPADTKLEHDLARTYNRLCSVYGSSGQYDAAVTNCLTAMQIGEAAKQRTPNDSSVRAALAATYQNVAGAYSARGDFARSKHYRLLALRELKDIYRLDPANEQYESALANAYLRLAGLEENMKEYEPARDDAVRSFTLFNDLVTKHQSDIRPKLNATFALQRLGSILISLGDLRGALHAFEQSLPIRQQLFAADPADASARINIANCQAAIGVTLLKMGNARRALPHFEAQREMVEQLAATDPLHVDYQTSFSEALENIGLVYLNFASKTRDTQENATFLMRARSSLQDAAHIYEVLKLRNAVPGEYTGVPARIDKALQSCEQKLKTLSAGSRSPA